MTRIKSHVKEKLFITLCILRLESSPPPTPVSFSVFGDNFFLSTDLHNLLFSTKNVFKSFNNLNRPEFCWSKTHLITWYVVLMNKI